MKKLRLLLAFLALLPATAYAVSIWGSTDRGPVAGTYRIPVDTSSSSSPGYITPLELNAYLHGSASTLTLGSTSVNLGTLGTGIVKNTTTTGNLTNAAAADVVGLFSSCTGTKYLAADGACYTAGGGGGITRSVVAFSSNTTLGATALTDYVAHVSGTTNAILPTAVGNTNEYTVVNVGAGVVTVTTTSSQTINGSSTAPINVQYGSITVVSNGSNWIIK